MIAENPSKVTSLNIEPIIRQGLKRYTDQIGVLWNSLADYYIRGGHFERVCELAAKACQWWRQNEKNIILYLALNRTYSVCGNLTKKSF